MNIEKERELYNDWHFNLWKKNCANSDSIEDAKKLYDRVYSHNHAQAEFERGFMAWCASTSREGYKMVPVEMSWQKADEISCDEWESKAKGLFISQNRDLTANQVEEFRLRWCKNRARQIMHEYKAMIGAVE